MKHPLNLTAAPVNQLFMHYLIPSICSTLVTSIYILADSIMIGRGVGSAALAALNLVLPFFSLLFGTGILLGVGAGVLRSVAMGSGDRKRANQIFTSSLRLCLLLAILFTALFILFLRPTARLLGAADENIELVISYLKYIVYSAPLFIFSSYLQAMVRNDGAPRLAMIAVISGGVANILLDYLFIFVLHQGMAGGAIASAIGTGLTDLLLLTHFLTRRNTMRWQRKTPWLFSVKKMVSCGTASFVNEMANGLLIFLFNRQILHYIGVDGVVVYSVIANCMLIAMSLFNGVSQAVQPLIAANYGARQPQRIRRLAWTGAVTVFALGALLFLASLLFPQPIIQAFVVPTPAILSIGRTALPTFFSAFLFLCLNLFLITYFQSIVQAKPALLLCLLRGFLLSGLLAFLLPLIWPEGIWWAVPGAELLTFLVSLVLLQKTKRFL